MGSVSGAGETLAQNKSRDSEAYETEGGQEAENTVGEDSDAAILLCVVTEFDGESPRDFLNFWPEFLPIFYLEELFNDFTRRDEVNEEEEGR